MKRNKILFPVAALAVLCAACDDDKMDWGTPEGETPISGTSQIPLNIQEQINNYDYIKNYVEKYRSRVGSQFILGLGLGADMYLSDTTVKRVADENFQMYTTGNAMKQGVMVKNNGDINFSTVDKFLAAVPADSKIYGHNFIWHTQQNQKYLKDLIAPERVIEADGDIANVLAGDASNFDGGTKGRWDSWGTNMKSVEVVQEGQDGSNCLKLVNNGDGSFYTAQCAYTFDTPFDTKKTYVIKFKAKSSSAAGALQFQYQNNENYKIQGGYKEFSVTDEWAEYQFEFQVMHEDANRILLNFGNVGGSYWVDDVEFGEKLEESDPMVNVLTGDNSDFNSGTTGGWSSWGGNMESVKVVQEGQDDSNCLLLKNNGDGDAWNAQCAFKFDEPLDSASTYIVAFKAKSSIAAGHLQFQYQNSKTNKSQGGYKDFSITNEWLDFQFEFKPGFDDVDRIVLNFGKVGGSYWVDDIKFGVKIGSANKATKIYYVLKTPEEKYEALDNAMEQWIKGMFEHIKGDNRFVAWDVINEAISDGGGRRGINGVFGGSWTEDDVTYYDQEPEETESEGLKLNWSSGAGNQHFYWGYYMGMDYAVKAYQYARKYADENGFSDLKLFYNDYNLETSPTKLNEVIEFIKDIDAANGSPIVDGIGTQMHVQSSISREEIDAMFKALAATGKLIRVTELDVATGSATPSSDQLKQQAKTYQNIVESYIENVPEAQRHGITIWSLSDAAEEHEFWLNGDAPNLFDANLARKWAYKGVCDAIAGEDIGAKLKGDDWTEKKYQDRKDTEAEDEE